MYVFNSYLLVLFQLLFNWVFSHFKAKKKTLTGESRLQHKSKNTGDKNAIPKRKQMELTAHLIANIQQNKTESKKIKNRLTHAQFIVSIKAVMAMKKLKSKSK